MSFNLCALPKEQQEKIEVEKAASYAVWKERNGDPKAESAAGGYQGEMQAYFLQQVERYRKVK